jgi:hypothetical protein
MKLSFIKAVKFAILRRSALTGGIEHLLSYQCQLDRPAIELRRHKKVKSSLFELARVLVRFDHMARCIVNANHGIHVNGCDASRSRFVARSSLFLEHLHRLPRFIRRRLFIFERALQIHLGQRIIGIKFQEA